MTGPAAAGVYPDPVELLAGVETPEAGDASSAPQSGADPDDSRDRTPDDGPDDGPGGVSAAERWAELRAEHTSLRLGPLWLQEITNVCKVRARRYAPVVYARSTSWQDSDIDDLVMDTVARLLEKHQLEYICDTVTDVGHARALLHRQVAFTLMERRTRTIVDNLLDRAVEELNTDGFTQHPGPPPSWTLNSAANPAPGDASAMPLGDARPGESGSEVRFDDPGIRLLGLRLRRLPRLPGKGADRASPVWTSETLRSALLDCLSVLGTLTRGVLQTILEDALTSLVASELVSDEAGSGHKDQAASPEEHVLAADAVSRLASLLDDQERVVLARKFKNVSDNTIAAELGISRPTVAARKDSGAAKVRDVFAELPQAAQLQAMQAFQQFLEADPL